MRPLSWLVEHRRGIGIYLAIWVVLAVLAAVEVYVAQQVWDKAIPWSVAFGRASKEALAYAICTLGVLWLCGRLRSHTGHRIRWVSLHMLGALAFSLLHVTVSPDLKPASAPCRRARSSPSTISSRN